MLTHLADVSIRSLLLALSAAVVLWILRGTRTAALQHAVWAVVVRGMLALFAFGQALPRLPLRVLSQPIAPSQPPVLNAPVWEAGPVEQLPDLPAPAPAARAIDGSLLATCAYAAVAFAFLTRFVIGMFLIRRLLAKSNPVRNFLESEFIAVPLTVGWLRPKILLPLEWCEWDREKLDAVLAHEGAHVRRRDGLIAALAGINRCIFWFHPLAWMLERKLTLLAEQACDESCVAALGDRERYARLLLEMARVVDGAHGRLRQHALTMAAASHIRQRIDSLLQEGRTFSRGLTWSAWAAVTLCGIPVVLGAGAVELDRQPPLLPLEMPLLSAPAPPVFLAQARPTPPAPTPAARPEFEVASIRPSVPLPPVPATPGGRRGAEGMVLFREGMTIAPGRAEFDGATVTRLIAIAFRVPESRITGPAWMAAQRFDIVAKLPEGASKYQVPEMLQALLAERFKLAVHRENKDLAVYGLVVAKGGLKLKDASPDSDATAPAPQPCPAEDLACSPRIFNEGGIGGIETLYSPLSRSSSAMSNPSLGTAVETVSANETRLQAPNTTFEGLAGLLPKLGGEPVVDMTGLRGRYQVVLEVPSTGAELLSQARLAAIEARMVQATAVIPDELTAAAILDAWQSALEKVGLRIEPRKAPVETIVVDHLEKTPTAN